MILDVPLSRLKQGPTVIGEVALLRDGDQVRATRTRCRHMNGEMRLKKGTCKLRCPRHGWELDLETMRYVNPAGATHPELRVELCEGRVQVHDDGAPQAWGERTKKPIDAGTFTLRFYAHACAEIEARGTRLFTDPWLVGPAFTRGWWLVHRPPEDWLDRLASADGIYVSHNHGDHLNPPTLEKLKQRTLDVPFYVPAFEGGSCAKELRAMGFRNVNVVHFREWVELGAMRFMILRDRTDRDDSAILVEHEGHRILDTVDCHNLGPLPEADVLLAQHTRGASGFPVCWEAQYGSRGVEARVRKDLALAEASILEQVESSRARVFVPFAGYFTEAWPTDVDVRGANRKNDPEEVCAAVEQRFAIPTWIPTSGGVLDVGEGEVVREGRVAGTGPCVEEMKPYVDAIDADGDFAPLETLEGVQRYFEWAGFEGELVLHVLETDERFAETLRELYVDFRTGCVETKRPKGPVDYLQMRVRRNVFRHVLRRGRSWEDLSIGFQARFFRVPDVYHFDFWDHFQHHLPEEPPPWAKREAA